MFNKILYMILMFLFIFTATGCSAENESETLRYIGFNIYDPVYIAQDRGLFEKHGVKVEIIELLAGGPTALQAIAGKSAEVCVSSYMATINARAQELNVMAISDIQSSMGEQALEEFFVRADSNINSASDLKGKKIAINLVKSSFHYTWLMALEEVGLTEQDVEFVILPFEQQELALLNGQVDAIGVMQPYVKHANDNKELKRLFTALDVFGERQFTTHVINGEWAENNPELTRAFVAAVAEAAEWIENNQEEAKLIISKHTGVDPKDIDDYYFQENAGIIMEDAEFWLDYMKTSGEVKNDDLTAEDLATNKYGINP